MNCFEKRIQRCHLLQLPLSGLYKSNKKLRHYTYQGSQMYSFCNTLVLGRKIMEGA